MPDLLNIISRWWKWIAGLTLIAAVLTLVILLLQPRYYLSVATALPANSSTFDKARIFNPNVQHLYSTLGTPDELDRFIGTASLEVLYVNLVKKYNLVAHYNIKGQSVRH